MDTFINQVLFEVQALNNNLLENKRTTGIMQTYRVVRNYLSYLEWYELIEKEGRFLKINSTASFLGSIYGGDDFKLNTKEKISLFKILIINEEYQMFINKLKNINQPRDFISIDLNEHLAETYLEWCFDLEILSTNSKKWGKFFLNKKFSNIIDANGPFENEYELLKIFSSDVLGTHIQIKPEYDPETIWKLAGESIRMTIENIRSDFDPLIFPSLPILLDIQIELIIKYNTLVKMQNLIDLFSKISHSRNVDFNWDYLSGDGYLKIKRI